MTKIAVVEVTVCDKFACPWHREYSKQVNPHLIEEERVCGKIGRKIEWNLGYRIPSWCPLPDKEASDGK